ncbi:MAG: hypothetical protein ACOZHQ_06000 [Thermodesulfobacteriota bacterium]
MAGLNGELRLARAWTYAAPRRPAECLPLVYGDPGPGLGGLWNAVCVDAPARVYALAGHALTALEMGNQVTLYDKDDEPIDPADYALELARDYQGRGVIATAAFAAEARSREPIGVRAQGKPGPDGLPLANPLDLARDLLLAAGGLDPAELDQGAFNRARGRAESLGFSAAGAFTRPMPLGQALTELMASFLGSWWRGGDGRLRLMLDLGPGAVDEGELTATLGQANLRQVSVSARLDDVVNQVEVRYAFNHRRQECEAAWSGPEAVQAKSVGLYGPRPRGLELKWVRQPDCARAIAARLAEAYAFPRRIVTCEEDSLANLHLEKGDPVLLSLPWLCDPLGRPLANQIMRVLGLEPQLDRGVIAFTLLDTGGHRTLTRPADGTVLADGSALAGGERDTREYRS